MFGPGHVQSIRRNRATAFLPTLLIAALCLASAISHCPSRPTVWMPSTEPDTVVQENPAANWPVTVIRVWLLVPQVLPPRS
ncbi:MAG: hypothetical protein RL091_1230 [Verrucomicrobiota bacterium]|jgi:hypothetical protein